MSNITILLLYILSGILAYGIAKNAWRHFILTLKYVGYDNTHELVCILLGISGFYGLAATLITTTIAMIVLRKQTFGLCYKMPKELWNSTRKAEYEAKIEQITNKIKELDEEEQRNIKEIAELQKTILSNSPRQIGRG